ncbi:MAG: YgiT-type zinc finger protein [Candidatus Rokubacteria bacterium]|nr:YgiT-type zinc finger protein [Candidatus Rokubacteria bacterium]MBI3825131.1 YgiT-type zinc finger protein [Candidatus Rokubacteria bacterium]
MTTQQEHRCGGTLRPGRATIRVELDNGFEAIYNVPGFICDKCHDELINHDTAMAIQKDQLPGITWTPPETARPGSRLNEQVFVEPAGTAVV